jgi:hypothetical protein
VISFICHISVDQYRVVCCNLKNLADSSLQNESIISSLHIANKLNEWEIVKILIWKCIKWVKISMCQGIFVILRQEMV